jgi:hypothetical protein
MAGVDDVEAPVAVDEFASRLAGCAAGGKELRMGEDFPVWGRRGHTGGLSAGGG